MKRSTDRILTTHMGSLPRPDVLADLLVAQAEGKPVDAARIPALTDEAMDHIVRRQLEAGIDVGNDGEMPRSTFFGYIMRPERHIPNSITTMRRRLIDALVSSLPRCPCCRARPTKSRFS
jgi:5-methyltetrahydropteroyltriglutamate--homocysteine methyltransferase